MYGYRAWQKCSRPSLRSNAGHFARTTSESSRRHELEDKVPRGKLSSLSHGPETAVAAGVASGPPMEILFQAVGRPRSREWIRNPNSSPMTLWRLRQREIRRWAVSSANRTENEREKDGRKEKERERESKDLRGRSGVLLSK